MATPAPHGAVPIHAIPPVNRPGSLLANAMTECMRNAPDAGCGGVRPTGERGRHRGDVAVHNTVGVASLRITPLNPRCAFRLAPTTGAPALPNRRIRARGRGPRPRWMLRCAWRLARMGWRRK